MRHMKPLLIGTVMGLAMIVGVSLLGTGCVTGPNGQQTMSPVAQSLIGMGITDGAEAATAAVLNKNPQYAPDFTLGASVLETLATGTNSISATAVAGTLESAGETNILVETVVINSVQNAATALNAQTNSLVQQQQLQMVMTDVAAGINQGIALHAALQPSTQ